MVRNVTFEMAGSGNLHTAEGREQLPSAVVMPPSRTRGAPAPEPQQRIQGTVLRLCALTKLSSLQGFADAAVWAKQFTSTKTSVTYACTGDGGEDVGRYDRLLEVFYAAISNGLRLLVLSWPEETSTAAVRTTYDPTLLGAAHTVCFLSQALTYCRLLNWYKDEHGSKEVDSAVAAGFLQHATALIGKLLPTLQNTAVPCRAIRELWPHHVVAKCLLELWCHLFEFWPGCKLTDSSVTATLEPAASLALALMHAVPADMTPANSKNSTSFSKTQQKDRMDVDGTLWSSSCYASVFFARSLLCAVHNECVVTPNSSSSNTGTHRRTAEAALASADVQRLMLFGFAAAAKAMHSQHASTSTPPPASAANGASTTMQQGRQQQYVDYGHLQLLAGLGIPEADILINSVLRWEGPRVYKDLNDERFHRFMLAVVGHLFDTFRKQHENSSSSSNFTQISSQRCEVSQVLLQQLALPVLHTLKDLTLILPDDDLRSVARTIWVFGVVARAVLRPDCFSAQGHQQVLLWLLQPLYHKTCKALRTIDQRQPAAGDSESSDLERKFTQSWAYSVQVFFCASGSAVKEYLLAAIKQDPVAHLAALEAVARTLGACIGFEQQQQQQQQLVESASRVVATVLTALTDGSHAEDMLAHPDVQLQLLLLISSHLKLVTARTTSVQPTSAGNDDVLAFSFVVANSNFTSRTLNVLAPVDHPFTDTQQTHAEQVTEAVHNAWLAVVGKGMYVTAVGLLKHLPIPDCLLCRILQFWVGFAHKESALALLAADEHGKAVSLAAEVHKQLEQLMASSATPIRGSDVEELSRQLLQQMQHCGSAICAAIPVKFWCNNLTCLNLAKLSEQQLVAGKGSRCSGCKVARYCSRECQLKHWKMHKKACKRLQAESDVVEGSS